MATWDLEKVEKDLKQAYEDNSELDLLKILKKNSFLFYELYSRKHGIQPNFCELSFGGVFRCDFAWLNDNSDGPEWVLVEVEKPKVKLFTQKGDPAADLNHAIEQVKSWDRYFNEHPHEKKRIFGAVSRFRYILIVGSGEDWKDEKAIKWRAYHNRTSSFEIKSMDVFIRALEFAKEKPEDLWSFEENPVSLKSTELEKYWMGYDYMDSWRKVLV